MYGPACADSQQPKRLDELPGLCISCRMLEQCRRRINALLAQPGMNKVLLANKAGVHRNTLNGVEKADWNPASQTLDSIMGAVERLEKA